MIELKKNKVLFGLSIIVIGLIIICSFIYFSQGDKVYKYLNEKETIELSDINVYGTSLNLSINDSFVNTYTFYDVLNDVTINDLSTTESITGGIDPNLIDIGSYYILNNEKLVVSNNEIDLVYYTPTTNFVNYKIEVKTVEDYLTYTKTQEDIPSDYYDIIIDPGHGGYDGGVIALDGTTLESSLNLAVSEVLKTKLEGMGYKVALTRSTDINPGADLQTQIESDVPSYCTTCRVGLVYASHAPYTISIHHNSGGGSGFEVFTSYLSDSTLSDEIYDALCEISIASDKDLEGDTDGNYKYTYNKLEDGLEDLVVDYYYIIRETGGVATNSFKAETSSNIGSEAILIELGYVDNQYDYSYLLDKAFVELEADAIASGFDNYISN